MSSSASPEDHDMTVLATASAPRQGHEDAADGDDISSCSSLDSQEAAAAQHRMVMSESQKLLQSILRDVDHEQPQHQSQQQVRPSHVKAHPQNRSVNGKSRNRIQALWKKTKTMIMTGGGSGSSKVRSNSYDRARNRSMSITSKNSDSMEGGAIESSDNSSFRRRGSRSRSRSRSIKRSNSVSSQGSTGSGLFRRRRGGKRKQQKQQEEDHMLLSRSDPNLLAQRFSNMMPSERSMSIPVAGSAASAPDDIESELQLPEDLHNFPTPEMVPTDKAMKHGSGDDDGAKSSPKSVVEGPMGEVVVAPKKRSSRRKLDTKKSSFRKGRENELPKESLSSSTSKSQGDDHLEWGSNLPRKSSSRRTDEKSHRKRIETIGTSMSRNRDDRKHSSTTSTSEMVSKLEYPVSSKESEEKKKNSSQRMIADIDELERIPLRPSSQRSFLSSHKQQRQPTSLKSMLSDDFFSLGSSRICSRQGVTRTCGRYAKVHQRSKYGKSLRPTISGSVLYCKHKPLGMRSRSRSRTPLGRRESMMKQQPSASLRSLQTTRTASQTADSAKAVQFWIHENYDESRRRRSRSRSRRREDEENASLGYSDQPRSSSVRSFDSFANTSLTTTTTTIRRSRRGRRRHGDEDDESSLSRADYGSFGGDGSGHRRSRKDEESFGYDGEERRHGSRHRRGRNESEREGSGSLDSKRRRDERRRRHGEESASSRGSSSNRNKKEEVRSRSSDRRHHRQTSDKDRRNSSKDRNSISNSRLRRESSDSRRRLRQRVPIESVSVEKSTSPSSITTTKTEEGLAMVASSMAVELPDPPIAAKASIEEEKSSVSEPASEKITETESSADTGDDDSKPPATENEASLPAMAEPDDQLAANFTIDSLLDEDEDDASCHEDGLANFSAEYEPHEVMPAPSNISVHTEVTPNQIALGIRDDSTDDEEDRTENQVHSSREGAFPTFSALEQHSLVGLERQPIPEDTASCSSSSTVSSWSSFAMPFEDDSSSSGHDSDIELDSSNHHPDSSKRLLESITDDLMRSLHVATASAKSGDQAETSLTEEPELRDESRDVLSPLKSSKSRFYTAATSQSSPMDEVNLGPKRTVSALSTATNEDGVSLLASPSVSNRPFARKWEPSTPSTPMDQPMRPMRETTSVRKMILPMDVNNGDDVSLLASPYMGIDDKLPQSLRLRGPSHYLKASSQDDISLLTSPSEVNEEHDTPLLLQQRTGAKWEPETSTDQPHQRPPHRMMMPDELPFHSDHKESTLKNTSSVSSSSSSSASSSSNDDNDEDMTAGVSLHKPGHAPSTATSVTADSSTGGMDVHHHRRCIRKLGLQEDDAEMPTMIMHDNDDIGEI